MFFVVSKILKVFLFPLTWILGLLVVAHFVKNKKWRKSLFVTAIIILVVFSNKPLLQWSQFMTTRSYSHQKMPDKYYNVAVIMGGYGNGMDTACMQISYNYDRGARLWDAVRLYESGIVEKIMISGDATVRSSADDNSDAEAFRRYLGDFGVHDSDIILEKQARNTRENATYSIAILDSLGYRPEQCLLVTSATHMRRSLSCFEQEGWTLDGYATNIYPKPRLQFYSFIPNWNALVDWHELLNEWFGSIVYKIVGY